MSAGEISPFALGFMTVSMASVTLLVLYCYARILRGERKLEGEADAAAKGQRTHPAREGRPVDPGGPVGPDQGVRRHRRGQ